MPLLPINRGELTNTRLIMKIMFQKQARTTVNKVLKSFEKFLVNW